MQDYQLNKSTFVVKYNFRFKGPVNKKIFVLLSNVGISQMISNTVLKAILSRLLNKLSSSLLSTQTTFFATLMSPFLCTWTARRAATM